MAAETFHIGQRLSLASDLCTVRYIGAVEGKPRIWLGVEWDSHDRGKHNGSHGGKTYFTCKSTSPTAASFVRPDQAWDKPKTFLVALEHKYFQTQDAVTEEVIFVSKSKQIEEVGFEKFARRQAELRDIHLLVLDGMQVRHQSNSDSDAVISATCAGITELDVSRNLFESWDELLSLARLFPKLRQLTLDGNRFSVDPSDREISSIGSLRSLSMANTLLSTAEIGLCLIAFPDIRNVSLPANNLSLWPLQPSTNALPQAIESIDLSSNKFTNLVDLQAVLELPKLVSLNLRANVIAEITKDKPATTLSTTVQTLDLSKNVLTSWQSLDEMERALPALVHLEVKQNPLMNATHSRDGQSLVIARYPRLQTVDRMKITSEMRLNAEKDYLKQIVTELSSTSEADEPAVLAKHSRWQALCEEYGTPAIVRSAIKDGIDPATLAARLVEIDFRLAPGLLKHISERSWTDEIPKGFNVYALHGIVGERLGVMPLDLRLIWETGEKDPVVTAPSEVEYWDSSDDEDAATDRWILREVELVPGTRALATYLEERRAVIRVEHMPNAPSQ